MRSPSRCFAFASAFVVAGAFVVGACSPSLRDTVPESRDVRGDVSDAGPPPAKGAYVYVVRRPHCAVGLVGAHFMTDDDAHHIVDRIADELETCAQRLEQRGELVSGAIQLVALTGSRGNAEISDIRFAPGGPVAANGLACIVAPLRASVFPAATSSGVPALAIEATWDRASSANTDGGAAAGKSL